MEGVSAENGPPGVGLNSDDPEYGEEADILTASPVASASSSSSDNVSTVIEVKS